MYAQEADHILIPLLDGDYALAQVGRTDDTRALLLLTSRRMTLKSEIFPFGSRDVTAALVTDLDQVPHDHWDVAGYETIPDLRPAPPDPADSEVTVHDPSVVEALANAIHGLYPWDGFPDPDFFTRMLRRPDHLPTKAKMKSAFPDGPDDA